jgi:hypothetical protein
MTGGERAKIQKPCRYIARPAVGLERLSLSAIGQVSLAFNRTKKSSNPSSNAPCQSGGILLMSRLLDLDRHETTNPPENWE